MQILHLKELYGNQLPESHHLLTPFPRPTMKQTRLSLKLMIRTVSQLSVLSLPKIFYEILITICKSKTLAT